MWPGPSRDRDNRPCGSGRPLVGSPRIVGDHHARAPLAPAVRAQEREAAHLGPIHRKQPVRGMATGSQEDVLARPAGLLPHLVVEVLDVAVYLSSRHWNTSPVCFPLPCTGPHTLPRPSGIPPSARA